MTKIFLFFSLCFFLIFSATPVLAKKNVEFSLPQKENSTAQKKSSVKRLGTNWNTALKAGSPAKRYFPETNAPIKDNGRIYVGTNAGIFYAVDQKTGKIIWEYKNDEGIATTAGLNADRLFVSDLEGSLLCLDKNSGELLWRKNFNKELLATPVLGKEKLYLIKGDNNILAISQNDGSTIWNKPMKGFIKKLTMRGSAAVTLADNFLYVGMADGQFYKLNAQDGAVLWDKNLSVPLSTFKDIDATAVIAESSIYVGGYFGALYNLNKSSGAILWKADIATGLPVLALDNLVVVTDTNGTVHALNKNTGKEIWQNTLNSSVASEPKLFLKKIFVSTFDHDAYLLDPATGQELQKISLGSGSINNPLVHKKNIYVLTNKAKLLSLTAN